LKPSSSVLPICRIHALIDANGIRLIDIVVIGLCAVICGAEGPTDMETYGETKAEWLKQFLEMPFGVPSHDTFGRVLSVIAPAEFERCLLKWVNA
jgi:DDE_Tnp_1-associated